MDQQTVNEDLQGFQKAVRRFTRNAKTIVKLENKKRMQNKADMMGMILAQIVGYSTLLITVSVVLKNFFMGR